MQIQKALMNERFRVSEVSLKFRIVTIYTFVVIYLWNVLVSWKVLNVFTVSIVFSVYKQDFTAQ